MREITLTRAELLQRNFEWDSLMKRIAAIKVKTQLLQDSKIPFKWLSYAKQETKPI